MRMVLAQFAVLLAVTSGVYAAHSPQKAKPQRARKSTSSLVHQRQSARSKASSRSVRVGKKKTTTKSARLTGRKAAPKSVQVGIACWYGKRAHGRKTASGERFDMMKFTAAHRELPLGTMLKVTNLRNGTWVIVRVTDRGPLSQERIIDLSDGAARVLGFRSRGLERVRLEIVPPPAPAPASEIQKTEIAEVR